MDKPDDREKLRQRLILRGSKLAAKYLDKEHKEQKEQDPPKPIEEPRRRKKRTKLPEDKPFVLPPLPEDLEPFHKELESNLKNLQGQAHFKERREWILKFLKQNDFLNQYFRQHYPIELKPKQDKWPLGWWYRYASIRKRLIDPKDKVFEKMLILLNYLWKARLSYTESIALTERIGAGKYRKIEDTSWGEREVTRVYGFIGKIDYPHMERTFGFSRAIPKDYFAEFVRLGFLHDGYIKDGKFHKFKRDGSHGQKVYAIGYYHPNKSGKTPLLPFLKNEEYFRKALANFDPYITREL